MPNQRIPERQQDRLYHDVWIPEETQALRREVRAFLDRDIQPLARAIGSREESRESFPWEAFHAMAQAGLLKVPFPAGVGRGLQFPALGTVVTIEEIAYHSNSLAGVYDAHCILAGQSLMRSSEALRARYLGPLSEGRMVAAFATTEPQASSDLSPAAFLADHGDP